MNDFRNNVLTVSSMDCAKKYHTTRLDPPPLHPIYCTIQSLVKPLQCNGGASKIEAKHQAQRDPVGRTKLEQSVDRALCRQARPSRFHFLSWTTVVVSPLIIPRSEVGNAQTGGVAGDITNHSHAGIDPSC